MLAGQVEERSLCNQGSLAEKRAHKFVPRSQISGPHLEEPVVDWHENSSSGDFIRAAPFPLSLYPRSTKSQALEITEMSWFP
jgi:hypothetical protein